MIGLLHLIFLPLSFKLKILSFLHKFSIFFFLGEPLIINYFFPFSSLISFHFDFSQVILVLFPFLVYRRRQRRPCLQFFQALGCFMLELLLTGFGGFVLGGLFLGASSCRGSMMLWLVLFLIAFQHFPCILYPGQRTIIEHSRVVRLITWHFHLWEGRGLLRGLWFWGKWRRLFGELFWLFCEHWGWLWRSSFWLGREEYVLD